MTFRFFRVTLKVNHLYRVSEQPCVNVYNSFYVNLESIVVNKKYKICSVK